MTSYDWDDGYSQDWTLTKAGDWDDTTIDSTTYDRSHNSVHELTQLASMGPALTYDSKGNLTADAASQTYEWDFDNLLKKITTSGGTVLDYAYDVYGRRVSRKVTPSMGSATTTAFVLASASEGGQVMAECDPTQSGVLVTRKYLWGSYVDDLLVQIVVGSPEVKYYHNSNRMYSSAAVTDSSGTVVERYAYTAYGEPTILNASGTVLTSSAIGNRWLFTGREWEPEAKVYYYRARYYEPKLGRFLGRDPIGYLAGVNLHAFVNDNPLNRIDPSGLLVDPVSAFATAMGVSQATAAGVGVAGAAVAAPVIVGAVAVTAVGVGIYVWWSWSDETEPEPHPEAKPAPDTGSGPDNPPCDKNGKCNPCEPPAGTIGWKRLDMTGKAHFNKIGPPQGYVPTPHIHVAKVNQTPYPECACHWNPLNDVVPGNDTSGMVNANAPVTGGGPAN